MIYAIAFSKDRALQLRSMLDSFYLHCQDTNHAKVYVIYASSSEIYRVQYLKLAELYKGYGNLFFVQEKNFRTTLLQLLNPFQSGSFAFRVYQFIISIRPRINRILQIGHWLIKSRPSLQDNYILFLVDDNIFVRDFSLVEAVQTLKQYPKAVGFSLRLGRNTNFNYMQNTHQSLPEFHPTLPNGHILRFTWTDAEYDFGYPLEVSSSIYNLKEILPLLLGIRFNNPSLLEGHMAERTIEFKELLPELICYQESVTFCNPINLVQNISANNRAGDFYSRSTQELARLFDDGYSVDIEKYNNFTPISCHQEVELLFKK
jgi:hypothetical protein